MLWKLGIPTTTNHCVCVQVHGASKGSATMLATIQGTGVASEVNMRNLLHTGEESIPGKTSLEVQKAEVSVVRRKGLISSKLKKFLLSVLTVGQVSGSYSRQSIQLVSSLLKLISMTEILEN